MGRYSVDFLIPSRRIALEADGVYWHRSKARDARKERWLTKLGWIVVRIAETDVEAIGARQAVRRALHLAEQSELPI